MRLFSPSNQENIFGRLLLRWLLCYFCGFFAGARCSYRGFFPAFSVEAARIGLWPTVLALFAVFVTVISTYLVLLLFAKGFYDALVLLRIVRLTQLGEITFWPFNACLLLLLSGLVICLISATRACLCIHGDHRIGIRFIFSKRFALFVPDALFLLILAFSACLLWQRLLAVLPLF